ncbi:MAG: PaaI family thioesterase, partial [Myxococcota bacterium]
FSPLESRTWDRAPDDTGRRRRAGRDRFVGMTEDEQIAATAHWNPTNATGAWSQKRRLAAAMRLVIERLVPSDAPEDELRLAAEGLERYADALTEHPRLRRVSGSPESANAGDIGAFFDQSPLIGLANPLAPPIRISASGDMTAEGVVTFGSAYEGPPGCVHGGFIAAAFDEVLGFVQSLGGSPGMTGTLTVKYLKPTPLRIELVFEARLLRIEGRKIFTEGCVRADGLVTAEATGLFITVDRSKMEALAAARDLAEAQRS